MLTALKHTFPFTHEQAVQSLLDLPWDRQGLRHITDVGVVVLHNTLGAEIRNIWGLRDRTWPLNRHYRSTYGLGSADDMSQLILQDFVSRVRGNEKFKVELEVAWLKKHWQDQGVDPLTLQRAV